MESSLTVPEVNGLDSQAAITTVREAGLTPSIETQPIAEGLVGKVVDQQPPAGSETRRGASICLVVGISPLAEEKSSDVDPDDWYSSQSLYDEEGETESVQDNATGNEEEIAQVELSFAPQEDQPFDEQSVEPEVDVEELEARSTFELPPKPIQATRPLPEIPDLTANRNGEDWVLRIPRPRPRGLREQSRSPHSGSTRRRAVIALALIGMLGIGSAIGRSLIPSPQPKANTGSAATEAASPTPAPAPVPAPAPSQPELPRKAQRPKHKRPAPKPPRASKPTPTHRPVARPQVAPKPTPRPVARPNPVQPSDDGLGPIDDWQG